MPLARRAIAWRWGEVLLAVLLAQRAYGAPAELEFTELPPIPDAIGFAGPFAGTVDDRLVVAGGTNFPDKPIWDGGKKVWYDHVYVLDEPKGRWRRLATGLPRPLAYGESVSWGGRMLLIGGSDATRHYADVISLRIKGDRAEFEKLPDLPIACAMMCGALVDSTVYIAGGLDSPTATRALHNFWALDLAAQPRRLAWRKLEPWPGPDRSSAIAGAAQGFFYLAGGIRLEAGPDGKQKQMVPYLADAYCYDPRADNRTDNSNATRRRGAWRKIADLPRPVAAAASPAMTLDGELLIFSGIDHTRLGTDPRIYPPFPRDIFAFDTRADRWTRRGEMPEGSSRITAGVTTWRGGYVIACGETAPSRRSPKVYWIRPRETDRGR